MRFQIYFDVIAEFLARTPSKVPSLYVGVRHITPRGSDVCLLCPGGEPQINKYDAEFEFVVRGGDPEFGEYVTTVRSTTAYVTHLLISLIFIKRSIYNYQCS